MQHQKIRDMEKDWTKERREMYRVVCEILKENCYLQKALQFMISLSPLSSSQVVLKQHCSSLRLSAMLHTHHLQNTNSKLPVIIVKVNIPSCT